MGLDVKKMDYGVLYKFLDEKDAYYTHGVWYVRKYNGKSTKEPVIYVYHFDLDGKIINIYCGNYINIKYQDGTVFSINGWVIDENSSIKNVGNKETMKKMNFSLATMTPLTPVEQDLLDMEIISFIEDPIAYFKKDNNKSSK